MDQQRVIMNFSTPPGLDDLEMIAKEVFDSLPEELTEMCEDLVIQVEDLADEAAEQELGLDDPYELLALFRSGKEITPGVQKKTADGDDTLILYRRAILDLWCETNEDLTNTVRDVMIEELGRNFEFSDEDIEEMSARHHQGML
jgi:predicted Zn-dependent protease with MMP-like domain